MIERSRAFSMLLVIACVLAIVARGQDRAPSARIAGHVYSAEGGTALAGAVVSLESEGSPRLHLHQLSAQDGSYAFEALEPGGYRLIAYRKGFVGELHGQDSRGLISATRVLSGQNVDSIDFYLQSAPNVTQMDSRAFSAAYPDKYKWIAAFGGRFSPRGNLFAIVVGDIEAGEPEQAWLYNLTSRKLVALTEPAAPHPQSVGVGAFVWSRDTLYVQAADSRRKYIVKATAEGHEEIGSVPRDVQAALAAKFGTGSSIVGNYRVSVSRACHGCNIELSAQSVRTGRSFKIADRIGAGEFVFDPGWPTVFYISSSQPSVITAFNLNTRAKTDLPLPTHAIKGLLAVKRLQAGFLTSYTAMSGSCAPQLNPQGEDRWLLPSEAAFRGPVRTENVCFVHMELPR